jgi:hypothetical protein
MISPVRGFLCERWFLLGKPFLDARRLEHSKERICSPRKATPILDLVVQLERASLHSQRDMT